MSPDWLNKCSHIYLYRKFVSTGNQASWFERHVFKQSFLFQKQSTNEPRHVKSNIMSGRPSKDSDQPRQLRRLIWVLAVCLGHKLSSCWQKDLIRRSWCLGLSETSHGSHRLEKYLDMKGFLEKSLKMKYALKSTGESRWGLEKYLNFTIFCKT